eukprot:gene7246-7316_t
MKSRLLTCLLLLLSYWGYGQCVLNVILTQPTPTTCAGNVVTLTANGGDSYTWYNAIGGNVVGTGQNFVTPVLNSSTTYYVVVSANGCSSAPLPVPVNIIPVLTNLHASASTVINWYNVPTGGVPLISSPDYTTPSLTSTTTYYVSTSSFGCESARVPVTVTVDPIPSAPIVQTDTVCYGSNATLTASGSGPATYQWFNALAGGKLLATGATYTTPALTNSTTYYVQASNGPCGSLRIPVNVIVKPLLSPPSVSGVITCSGSVTTLTATSQGGTYQWFDAPLGGNLLATTATYTTPPAGIGNGNYYSSTYYSGAGTDFSWYDSPTGGNLLSTSQTFVTPSLTSQTTYYVQAGSGTCASLRAAVTVSINPAPLAPTANGTTICPGTTATLTASGPGVIQWYDAPAGGSLLTSGNTFTTPALNSTTTYYIQNPQFQYASGTFCTSSPNAVPVINNPAGGVFSAVPAGLVFVDNKTGEINIGASTPGDYSISFLGNGNPQFSFTGPYCQDSPNPLPVFPKNSSGGVFTAAPSGLVFVSSSTGEINLSVSQPGTYTITNTIPATAFNYKAASAALSPLENGVAAQAHFQTQLLLLLFIHQHPSSTVLIVIDTTFSAPVVPGTSVCFGSSAVLAASASSGVYQWYDAPAGGKLLATGQVYTTPALTANTTYYVQASNNGFTSSRTAVLVTVNNVPIAPSVQVTPICSGNTALITATGSTGTYQWYDSAIGGNLLAIGNTYNTPVLTANTTYFVEATFNGCTSGRTEVDVPVSPVPNINSAPTGNICSGNALTYTITASLPNATFVWNRVQVAGITNPAAVNQTSSVINETLINNGSTAVNVTYVITPYNGTCPGPAFNYVVTVTCTGIPFTLVITVNPTAAVTSAALGSSCNGVPQNYTITSNIPSAIFLWSRSIVAGISNTPVNNQPGNTITEALVNTSNTPVKVVYTIVPLAYGCNGSVFHYSVIVNPSVAAPVPVSNSPVCVGSIIHLTTATIPNASYLWTGPNGFTSTQQNPNISNANDASAGTYNLSLIVNGCSGPAGSVTVSIDHPSVANAGPDQYVCVMVPSVQLAGNVSGGGTTGTWSSAGTGTFSPSASALNASYVPSDADRAAGSVVLTLATTNNANCAISTSNMTIKFGPSPGVVAGPDQTVCAQTTGVKLAGKILIGGGALWTTSGSGTFSPSADQTDATYIPGADDVQKGSVVLTLRATAADACYIATNSLTVNLIPPATVFAGGTRDVLQGHTITLTPTVSESNVKYLWFPNIGLSSDTVKNPVLTGGSADRVYTLTVTDSRGCISSDQTLIKVQPEIIVPNTFTPNGDGINDVWNISGLIAYTQTTVDIFTRYGQKVYHSNGYDKPWDGTLNNQALPVGVYYYIIDTKVSGQVLSGYVTIIR